MVSSVKLLVALMWFPVFFYWEDIEATFTLSVVLWVVNGITMVFYAGLRTVVCDLGNGQYYIIVRSLSRKY